MGHRWAYGVLGGRVWTYHIALHWIYNAQVLFDVITWWIHT